MSQTILCPGCGHELELIDAFDEFGGSQHIRRTHSGFAHDDGAIIRHCPHCEQDLDHLVDELLFPCPACRGEGGHDVHYSTRRPFLASMDSPEDCVSIDCPVCDGEKVLIPNSALFPQERAALAEREKAQAAYEAAERDRVRARRAA